ncbi:MAG: multicopper oxidase domain-containing protein [Chloroflexi bacterium]|nr:multicopper oxidase domain-containing protein [Chloroflexota bacterium]
MRGQLTRREFLKYGAVGVGGLLLPVAAGRLIETALHPTGASAGSAYIEKYPTSPLILDPFNEPLPIPQALAPVPRSVFSAWSSPPGPGVGQQDSDGGMHQIWTSQLGLPDPIVYQVKLQVAAHRFTSSKVLPIDRNGRPAVSWDERRNRFQAGTERDLPPSTIYGFNGTFPGPMINAEYGRPVLVRFENHLDENPLNLDRQDFGSPDWGSLTHQHNGHTAAESDGNPFYKTPGYYPGQWSDNLYLGYPAGGDDRQKQSFLWYHDHFMDHTSANVYKGMVGLYPLYDPAGDMDMGDESRGLRLPGARTNNPDGSFDVEYDIPLAFYDVALDDGVTPHKDFHSGSGETHPEWWGKTFFRHLINKGFVGDIFTVNGVAYPVLEVKRRKYRLRFLDASISRIYEFKLMSSTAGPKAAASLGYGGEELQGQYRLPDGQQSMKFLQIATDGGLMPAPIARDSFELWPAKRREAIVDFTRYIDGSPTRKGDVVYLVNVLKMTDGRKPDSADPDYKVPVMKIVIGDDAPDNSLIPPALRAVPSFPSPQELKELVDNRRVFELSRGSGGPEAEWLINGEPFDHTRSYASPKRGSWEAWEIRNGGGGWVHPIHIHEEEHRVVMRDGKSVPDTRHPDDVSKEDVIALDEGESVVVVRQFRTFVGKYVCHCHNLAHEDHAMMFGWDIVP